MAEESPVNRGTLARLKGLTAELGFIDTLWYLGAKGLSRFRLGRLHRYCLVAQPVGSQASAPPRGQAIQVRQVAEAEYQIDWFPRPELVIRDRYRQGAQCLVAFRNERPIGCLWLIREAYMEDEVRCRYLLSPPEQTAWDFDVYLHPEHRFGRAFARLWDAADALLASEGRHWTLSRIDAFNAASLRAHLRRGAQVVGQVMFLKTSAFQLLLSNRAPYFHISADARRIPDIRVCAPVPGSSKQTRQQK